MCSNLHSLCKICIAWKQIRLFENKVLRRQREHESEKPKLATNCVTPRSFVRSFARSIEKFANRSRRFGCVSYERRVRPPLRQRWQWQWQWHWHWQWQWRCCATGKQASRQVEAWPRSGFAQRNSSKLTSLRNSRVSFFAQSFQV